VPVLEGRKASDVQDAFTIRWLSLRGITACVVSDRAKELLDKSTVEFFEKQGTCKETTPAYDSDAHGRIERAFATLRWAIDRVQASDKKPETKREWELLLCRVENDARNVILRGGYSASQRAWGRGTSMFVENAEGTVATDSEPEMASVARVLELQVLAREAYWHARTNRALGAVLSQRARPETRDFSIGEAVFYRRPGSLDGGAKSAWHGPAVVCSRTDSMNGSSVQYHVSHGGVLHSVGPADLKGVLEPRRGASPRPFQVPPEVVEDLRPPQRKAPEPADREKEAPPVVQVNSTGLREEEEQALLDELVEQKRLKRGPGRPRLTAEEKERNRVERERRKQDE